MKNVEGIPEGWELVRIGVVSVGEWFVDGLGKPSICCETTMGGCAIIKQVEPPKPTYRPFANAAEFKPHRDRWVKRRDSDLTCPLGRYNEVSMVIVGEGKYLYSTAFAEITFDDGTPFGIEVQP